MHALLVLWDFSNGTKMGIDELRTYIRDESMARFRQKEGLRQKVWISNGGTLRWGAMYLFETCAQAEAQAATVTRVEEMTGVKPTHEIFAVEAVVEGQHSGVDLLTSGRVWQELAAR
jgi:hypothetical protein